MQTLESRSQHFFLIQGVTITGTAFRPTDWAERLASVMSSFRPGGPQPGSHLSYSPWCFPCQCQQIKAVAIHSDLREAEPMAWDFVVNFAKDNDLQVLHLNEAEFKEKTTMQLPA